MDALEKKIEELEAAEKTYQEEKTQDVHGFRGYWKDHLYLETNDKNIILGIGARMNMDAAAINGNHNLNESVGKQMDGTDVRRFRLHLYGTFYDDIFFKLQPDFSVQSNTEQRPTAWPPASVHPEPGGDGRLERRVHRRFARRAGRDAPHRPLSGAVQP